MLKDANVFIHEMAETDERKTIYDAFVPPGGMIMLSATLTRPGDADSRGTIAIPLSDLREVADFLTKIADSLEGKPDAGDSLEPGQN